MFLSRNVTVKSRVTDRMKAEVAQQAEDKLRQCDEAETRLDQHVSRLLLNVQNDLNHTLGIRQQQAREKQELESRRTSIRAELAELCAMENGSEVAVNSIDGFVKLEPGAQFGLVMGGAEVVIEDGIVVEIRDPATGWVPLA